MSALRSVICAGALIAGTLLAGALNFTNPPAARAAVPIRYESLKQSFLMLDAGESRELPAPPAGTHYISANPAIVTVTPPNRLHARAKGTTKISLTGDPNSASLNTSVATVTVAHTVQNPVLPFEWNLYFPDNEAHNIAGTVYLFGSLDAHSSAFCSPFYVSLFSRDLRRWESTGITISNKQTPPRPNSHKKRANSDMLWDSDGFFDRLSNRFSHYGFYADHINGKNNHIFVADGASPTGPFSNFRWLTGDKSGAKIDGISAQIFQDDDGSKYITYAPTAHVNPAKNYPVIARLLDAQTVEEATITNIGPALKDFYEGPSLRKRAGTYYFIYAENTGKITLRNRRPVRLSYATSKNIFGPYSYHGVFLSIEDMPGEGNIQGSIEQLNDQWFVFYHRSPFGVFNRRALCVEKIQFDDSGKILPLRPTSSGVADALRSTDEIHAGTAVIFENLQRGEYGADSALGGVRGGVEPAQKNKPATLGFRYVAITGNETTLHLSGDNLDNLKVLRVSADNNLIAAGSHSADDIHLLPHPAVPRATLTISFTAADPAKKSPVLRSLKFNETQTPK